MGRPEYIDGAKFLRPEEEDSFDRELWPRDPSYYVPSGKFQRRWNRLRGIINQDDITGAIQYGELYPAARACVSFVNDLGGVVIYVVSSSDLDKSKSLESKPSKLKYPDLSVDDYSYTLVTLWPYVYDRDRAWATGRWTGQELDEIEELEPEQWDQ